MRRTNAVCAAWLLLLLAGCAYHFPDDPLPPDPAPVVETGFRVLFVYESGESLSGAQAAIVSSVLIREYLDAKCAKVNGRPEYRFWDKDTPIASETLTMKEMLALPRKEARWLIVSNGKTGYSGPWPANVDETLTLLKKYGG